MFSPESLSVVPTRWSQQPHVGQTQLLALALTLARTRCGVCEAIVGFEPDDVV